MVQRVPPPRPFSAELQAETPPLRIGLMAKAPLEIPTDPACVEAAQAAAELLEGLGHSVEPVEVETISLEMVPPFIALTQAGLADYDGVDWSKVEPHVAHARAAAGETSSYDYVLAAKTLELLSRREVARWGRDFDVLLTPTSAVLPPLAGTVPRGPARRARPAGGRGGGERLVHRLRQRDRPAGGQPAAALHRREPPRRRPADRRTLAGGDADLAGRGAGTRGAMGRAAARARHRLRSGAGPHSPLLEPSAPD